MEVPSKQSPRIAAAVLSTLSLRSTDFGAGVRASLSPGTARAARAECGSEGGGR